VVESQAAHRLLWSHATQDLEALSKENPSKQLTQIPVEQSEHPLEHFTIFPSTIV
jgi:hypothetical protein